MQVRRVGNDEGVSGTPLELVADCDRCFGLCCVLLPFRAADGFGVDKAGGETCANLDAHDRCRIHAELAETGWPGCVAFDCQGAGQQVAQVTYGGVSWRDRDEPHVRAEMGAVLSGDGRAAPDAGAARADARRTPRSRRCATAPRSSC